VQGRGRKKDLLWPHKAQRGTKPRETEQSAESSTLRGNRGNCGAVAFQKKKSFSNVGSEGCMVRGGAFNRTGR